MQPRDPLISQTRYLCRMRVQDVYGYTSIIQAGGIISNIFQLIQEVLLANCE